MKFEVKFAEMHTPIFLGGKNLGHKLDISKFPGLQLFYDKKEQELEIHWNTHIGYAPRENIGLYVPLTAKVQEEMQAEMKKPVGRPPANTKMQAQVSTPHGHVFHDGPGETGVGQRIK